MRFALRSIDAGLPSRARNMRPRFLDTNILLYSISRDPAEAANREIAIALSTWTKWRCPSRCYRSFACKRPAPRGRTPLLTTSRFDLFEAGCAFSYKISRCRS